MVFHLPHGGLSRAWELPWQWWSLSYTWCSWTALSKLLLDDIWNSSATLMNWISLSYGYWFDGKWSTDSSLRIYNCLCAHLMQEELLWTFCGKSTTVASQELSFVPELMILTKVVRSAKAPSTLFTCVLWPLLLDGFFMLLMNVVQQILLHTVRGPTLVTKMSYLFVNIHHMNFKIFLGWKSLKTVFALI